MVTCCSHATTEIFVFIVFTDGINLKKTDAKIKINDLFKHFEANILVSLS